ncbi:MAG: hypothetical protein WC510_02860 [Candidatus Omnitrophota bacterium]
MPEDLNVFELIRLVFSWLNPIIFVIGVLLLAATEKTFKKIEEFFDQEKGFKKRVVPLLEKDAFNFQQWTMKNRRIIGLFSIIYVIWSATILR